MKWRGGLIMACFAEVIGAAWVCAETFHYGLLHVHCFMNGSPERLDFVRNDTKNAVKKQLAYVERMRDQGPLTRLLLWS